MFLDIMIFIWIKNIWSVFRTSFLFKAWDYSHFILNGHIIYNTLNFVQIKIRVIFIVYRNIPSVKKVNVFRLLFTMHGVPLKSIKSTIQHRWAQLGTISLSNEAKMLYFDILFNFLIFLYIQHSTLIFLVNDSDWRLQLITGLDIKKTASSGFISFFEYSHGLYIQYCYQNIYLNGGEGL